MATKQEDNRKNLYNIIKNEFILSSTNKVLTYDEWFKIFFKNSNTLSDQSSTSDENGNVKYNNLFSIINFKKILGLDDTIIKYYFTPEASGYDVWKNVLTKKQEFYKTFACDLDWAKSLNFCGGVNNVSNVNTDGYVGEYSSDLIKKLRVYPSNDDNDVNVLNLSSIYFDKIPRLSTIIGDDRTLILTPTSEGNTFTISNSQGILIPNVNVVFTADSLSINLKMGGVGTELLKAKKITSKDDEDSTPTKDNEKKDSTTNTTKKPDDKKSDIPIVKSKPLYFNNDKKINIPTKPCDKFPFELGCVNTKIGDINAKLFDGNRFDDTYEEELFNFLDNAGYFKGTNKEITQDIWNKINNRGVIKESVKKVLKEYINKKK